ncbi:hypothetical protein AAFF_G00093400 [Aldrovandia affinis]|uniref:Uncharacterized protein n=1 Tax=Aldrovandia affinis TaxID=143900 RepID=A0AAD7T2P8_9TELE|nr:hypothetical protein AAFF_G00093400 [Aldrovandia affinis]
MTKRAPWPCHMRNDSPACSLTGVRATKSPLGSPWFGRPNNQPEPGPTWSRITTSPSPHSTPLTPPLRDLWQTWQKRADKAGVCADVWPRGPSPPPLGGRCQPPPLLSHGTLAAAPVSERRGQSERAGSPAPRVETAAR